MARQNAAHVSSMNPHIAALAQELFKTINSLTSDPLSRSYVCACLAKALMEETHFGLIDTGIALTEARDRQRS